MKILQPDLPGANGVKAKNARGTDASKAKPSETPVSSSSSSKKGDQVQISSIGYQMKSLEAKAKEIPDVRVDKVEAMKSQLANGYHPAAEDVADAIIRTVSIL